MPSNPDPGPSPSPRSSSPIVNPRADTNTIASPATSSASIASYQKYDDIADEDHRLGKYYISRDRLQNIKASEVKILSTPYDNDNSAVCIVEIRGITCAMKVHHGQRPGDAELKDYFLDELTAYRRLKNRGFCERGTIPDIYGVVLNMKPQDWPECEIYYRPGTYMMPVNAILLENVEKMQSLTMENYTPARMEKWRDLIKEFHAVDVTHGDIYPRNMMFVPAEDGKPERVLWLDFESGYYGEIGSEDFWDDLHRRGREDEAVRMDDFVRLIAINTTEHNRQPVRTKYRWLY
ncbi:hypothetical protein VHEMI08158 [[Torrubiella] hemipterigena]|uniref:Protein kinase domain-containing protein n=1 Tax=[Torrubiella] hemipterigena TaxID=1531966 RepID=A0A0A1TMX5_9HYPO|nr:hypothetical protein VHEMI08158 [[Torrubiella] hemipterigena]